MSSMFWISAGSCVSGFYPMIPLKETWRVMCVCVCVQVCHSEWMPQTHRAMQQTTHVY